MHHNTLACRPRKVRRLASPLPPPASPFADDGIVLAQSEILRVFPRVLRSPTILEVGVKKPTAAVRLRQGGKSLGLSELLLSAAGREGTQWRPIS